jgi:hypothetical protein
MKWAQDGFLRRSLNPHLPQGSVGQFPTGTAFNLPPKRNFMPFNANES